MVSHAASGARVADDERHLRDISAGSAARASPVDEPRADVHSRPSESVVIERGMTTTHSLADLGDRPLLETAKRLATEERHATVALLRALSEIDSRRPARRRTLRVCRRRGAVPGDGLPRVPPRGTLRGRRRCGGRQHPAALPRAQRARGAAVLRRSVVRAGWVTVDKREHMLLRARDRSRVAPRRSVQALSRFSGPRRCRRCVRARSPESRAASARRRS